MYGYGMYGFLDPTFLLVILGLVIFRIASAYVNSTFRKYDQVRSKNNVTGTQAAQYILQSQQINNVGIQRIAGDLTDNYNSGNKMLSLSQATAQSTSVAAIGVAAHPMRTCGARCFGVCSIEDPCGTCSAANFGSMISFPLIMVGVLLSWNSTLINIGIFAFLSVYSSNW